jgi:LysR family transcriptional regulator, nod-box dependent transcriptional activator
MPPNFWEAGHGLICVGSAQNFSAIIDTRAPPRVNSQPAMSRTLERLRETLGDELLVRSPKGYLLTARATRLLQELDRVLPLVEDLWTGETFAPERTKGKVRFGMTDLAASLLVPCLTEALQRDAPNLGLEITPYDRAYDDLATGKMDLLFSPVEAPAPLRTQYLYADTFTCVISEGNSLQGENFTVDQYLGSKHIVVSVAGGQQILVDRPLTEAGYRRKVFLRMPYFLPALASLCNTDYVLTTASRPIQPLLAHYRLRQVKPPPEIPSFNYPFNYLMVWHPRLDSEELHVWFRNLVRTTCEKEFG